MASQLPATTDDSALPATLGVDPPGPALTRRPGQNVTAGLFPIALAVLALACLGLAFWTLMAVTGGGL